MDQDKSLILLVGKSGSGKDYIADTFCLKKVVSRTTRPIRVGETDGVDHVFVTPEEMGKYSFSQVVAYTKFDGKEYCALRNDLNGKNVYILDPAGIDYFERAVRKHSIRRNISIVYVKSPWFRRLYRMIRRDSLWKSMRRIVHDYKAFKKFEKGNSYRVIRN